MILNYYLLTWFRSKCPSAHFPSALFRIMRANHDLRDLRGRGQIFPDELRDQGKSSWSLREQRWIISAP